MSRIKYLIVDDVIEINRNTLSTIKVKKADKPEVLSYNKIVGIVKKVRGVKGDIYDKASFLLINLIRQHPFASGNRRSAIVVVASFLDKNGFEHNLNNIDDYNILKGIREGYYEDEEIKEWIRTGSIREFKRK